MANLSKAPSGTSSDQTDPTTALEDGQIVSLDEARGFSRRDFCRTAMVALGAVAALPACVGDGEDRIGVGGIDETGAGIPTGGGNGGVDAGVVDLAHGGTVRDLAGSNAGPVDLAHAGGGPVDLAHAGGSPDLAKPAGMNTCPNGVTDTGKTPASVGMNQAIFIRNLHAFICRDAGGYFGLSSVCPHQGCDVGTSAGGFTCPCHRWTFNLSGSGNRGSLDHYAVCTTANGTVGMDTSQTIGANTRFML